MRIGSTLCIAVSAVVLALTQNPAEAAKCGSNYLVKPGDTLSEISQRLYGTATKWRTIYRANRKKIGRSVRLLRVGQGLKIPCLPGQTRLALATPDEVVQVGSIEAVKEIALLTADDYRPFTDRALPAGGMITDIIDSALKRSSIEHDGPAHKISWVNDWSAHLSPLLVKNAFDMGFPWFRPECEQYDQLDKPAQFRCDTFHFSSPVFEIIVRFFVNKDSTFEFKSDAEVEGKRICRPAGYFTFDLDKEGRNWVKDDKITLLRPQRVEDCFRLLERKEVDAIALNEFTGYEAISKLGMGDSVRTIQEPVSLLSLHIVIPKKHKRADAFLEYVNRSLGRLRETGAYDRIVDRHLVEFWKTQKLGKLSLPGSG